MVVPKSPISPREQETTKARQTSQCPRRFVAKRNKSLGSDGWRDDEPVATRIGHSSGNPGLGFIAVSWDLAGWKSQGLIEAFRRVLSR